MKNGWAVKKTLIYTTGTHDFLRVLSELRGKRGRVSSFDCVAVYSSQRLVRAGA